ncbi:hypothetical protein [Burkholderia vietnamiensis]|uniref:hypothetical protein n=1 Tax=Burkholderia vietnamiensis TaxID=60552 RepID=UPI0020131A5B|nr:hypothetical protein [Burkholderia vietnamiensis]
MRRVDAGAEPVQAIVKRWQQLFRDSFCGDDAVLEARLRDAIMREPDLQFGVGPDDSSLVYLHDAHIGGRDMSPVDAGPKPSALMVATQRAAHQLLEHDNIDRFREPASIRRHPSIETGLTRR